MPTYQAVSKFVETDLGWAVARPVHDLTGAAVALEVECKACKVVHRYATLAQPGILSRFDHLPDCRVLREIKAGSEPYFGSPNRKR